MAGRPPKPSTTMTFTRRDTKRFKRAAKLREAGKLDEAEALDARAADKVIAREERTTRRIKTHGIRSVRRGGDKGGDIVTHLLTIRNQIKLYHWQTKQFSRHTATDALTAALDLSIDNFVESYMGRYGRPTVTGSIKLHNFSEAAAKSFVSKETKYLETDLPRTIGKTDSDLLNIRDEILAELTKVSYLFTLK